MLSGWFLESAELLAGPLYTHIKRLSLWSAVQPYFLRDMENYYKNSTLKHIYPMEYCTYNNSLWGTRNVPNSPNIGTNITGINWTKHVVSKTSQQGKIPEHARHKLDFQVSCYTYQRKQDLAIAPISPTFIPLPAPGFYYWCSVSHPCLVLCLGSNRGGKLIREYSSHLSVTQHTKFPMERLKSAFTLSCANIQFTTVAKPSHLAFVNF